MSRFIPLNPVRARAKAATTPHNGRHGLTDTRFEVIYTDEDFVTINKAFPHIGKKIAFLWGSPEFYPFMHELQYDERRANRHGFPPEVLMAAHQLTQTHSTLHPQLVPRQTDIWTQHY